MDVYWSFGDNQGAKQALRTTGHQENGGEATGYTMGPYPEQCHNSRSSVEARIGNEESISTPYGAALHEPV